jgi:hypothetical protein
MSEAQIDEIETLYCSVHPAIETTLRCNKCNRPMCTRCAVLTPVGYRCKECVRGHQQIFYTATPFDLLAQGAVSFAISIPASFVIGLMGNLGFFLMFIITIPAASAAGVFIADMAHRAAGRRRGQYSWLVVCAGLVLGALVTGGAQIIVGLMAFLLLSPEIVRAGSPLLNMVGFMPGFNLGWLIYVIAGCIAASGRLRLGK